ncbi:MAG TPA: arginase family protein [Terriglobales bacterium]|nr:arginase family protein [Terriglobales bacterium]
MARGKAAGRCAGCAGQAGAERAGGLSHIDRDSLDPQVAPGVVFDPVPGGLSLEDMEEGIRAAFARFRVRAATLSVYDPDRDQEDKTLRAGLRIIEVLAEEAAREIG